MNFRQTLFWDADPKAINIKKNAPYIIERILEFGNDRDVRWLWNTYSAPLLKKVIKKSHSLSPKTKILWNLLLKSK